MRASVDGRGGNTAAASTAARARRKGVPEDNPGNIRAEIRDMKFEHKRGNTWCASGHPKIRFRNSPQSTVITFEQDPPPRDPAGCRKEIDRALEELAEHEAEHRRIAEEAAWWVRMQMDGSTTLTACAEGRTPKKAKQRARDRLREKLDARVKALVREYEEDFKEEPPQPTGPDCTKCEPCRPGLQQPADACTPPPTRVRCACNGQVYDDVQVCLAECRVSLGCFVGICEPV